MKLKIVRLSIFWIILMSVIGLSVAQEDNWIDLYSDIPQSRSEDGAFILGDPDAPITIIEFADYLCGHCQNYEAIMSEFIEEFVATGKAKFEFRVFPIIDDNYSPLLGSLSECAAEEGVFWGAKGLIFDMAAKREIGSDVVDVVSNRLGLDVESINACIANATQYITDYELGVELGVNGTPAVRVRVGDDLLGAILIDGTLYDRGGPSLEALQQFVQSDDPASMVALVNQLRNDRLLTDDSLITGESCAAPCWREIIPGVTLWGDAVAIIEADKTLANVEVSEAPDDDRAQIVWSELEGGELCCQIFTQDGKTVTFIWMRVAPNMTLGDLVDTHGEPAYLIGGEYTKKQAFVSLFYVDTPMIVTVFVDGVEEGVLSETSEVIGFQYLTQVDMERTIMTSSLHAWDGYKSFSDYMDSEFEVVPQ